MGDNFVIKTVHDNINILQWHDNVTLKNIDQFKQEVDNLLKTSSTKLILNIENLGYINSAGLGVIADGVMQARRNQQELVVCDIQQSIREIFDIVKFSSFIKLFNTEAEAMQFFQAE